MRSEDVPELKTWLQRTSYKWLSHSIVDEIVQLLADNVIKTKIEEIQTKDYFSLILDESTDSSKREQASFSFRIVDDNLDPNEIFMGLYELTNIKSETLFNVVQDVFARFDFQFSKLRGQCYDGASNVRGAYNGLQAKIRAIEPRALFIHCIAHNVSLVSQDAMRQVDCARDFIEVCKDLIDFIRESPKRLGIFKEIQDENQQFNDEPEHKEKFKKESIDPENQNEIRKRNSANKSYNSLIKFNPTRWTLRVNSLKPLKKNYESCLDFFHEIFNDKTVESKARSKANGYFSKMMKSDFYILFCITISALERIEVLNTSLQDSRLNISEAQAKVNKVLEGIKVQRQNSFDQIWNDSVYFALSLDLEEPTIPKTRTPSSRIDPNPKNAHIFKSSKEYYEKQYKDILDKVITLLTDRFNSADYNFYKDCEHFLIGNQNCYKIMTMYKDDFNKLRLLLHRDMILRNRMELKSNL